MCYYLNSVIDSDSWLFELYLCFYLQKIHINKNPVF